METTPKAMEIEYIRIKRLNQGREKAYATGTNVICCYYGSRKIEPFKIHVNSFHTQEVYTESKERYEQENRHYKIFCVNGKYGIPNRVPYFLFYTFTK